MNPELESLIAEARQDMEAVGLPLPSADRFTYVIKTMRSWGTCHYQRYYSSYKFTIALSTQLMTCDRQAKMNTLTHEFIHACYPGEHHGTMFKRACHILNEAFPDKYDLSRTTSASKKMTVEQAKQLYKHVIVCPKCGKFFTYMRSCEGIDCIHWCKECKVMMHRIK